MLPNPLSWNPNSKELVYSCVRGKGRIIYLYDVFNEQSQPIKFPENDWFEFQFIHNEQLLIHAWKTAIYLHDIPTKKSQKMVDTPLARSFYFDRTNKKLSFNSEQNTYLFDPKAQKTHLLVQKTNEIIIDPIHQTFITITDGEEQGLKIYYKGDVVFEVEKAFNIFATDQFSHLLYFIEDDEISKTTLYLLDLNSLEITKQVKLNGLVQNANLVNTTLHVNLQRDTNYTLCNIDVASLAINTLQDFDHDDQVFSALSDDENYVAILTDYETTSQIRLIELDNGIQLT